MIWHFEKFMKDPGVYAICPKCSYTYRIGLTLYPGKYKVFNYCPECGLKLIDKRTKPDKYDIIWNQRNIDDIINQIDFR